VRAKASQNCLQLFAIKCEQLPQKQVLNFNLNSKCVGIRKATTVARTTTTTTTATTTTTKNNINNLKICEKSLEACANYKTEILEKYLINDKTNDKSRNNNYEVLTTHII